MQKINEELNYLRSKLKDMLNADNTEAITDLSKHIDALENEAKAQETKVSELKDKLVDYVKNTSFKGAPEETIEDEHKSLDDILQENLAKIVNNRK